jgi:hypothetical protein
MRRLRNWLEALLDRAPADDRSSSRPWRLGLAATLFVAIVIWAYVSWDGELDVDLRLAVVLLTVGMPAAICLVGWEQYLAYTLAGQSRGIVHSIEVGIGASAANLLPIPGALIVRATALKQAGASLKRSVGITTLLGILWLAVTSLVVGLAVAPASAAIGLSMCVIGLVVSFAVLGVLRRRLEAPTAVLSQCVVAVALKVVVTALNLWLAYRVLGVAIDISGALIVSSAGVIATAAGFFPGGLGLWELLSSIFARISGYESSEAVLATATVRVAWIIALALGWLVVNVALMRQSHRRAAADR